MKYNKLVILLIVFSVGIVLLFGINKWIVVRKIENFEEKKVSASEEVAKALQKIIRTANTVGRRMLSPTMWQERMNLINKTPMELARMHIINNS